MNTNTGPLESNCLSAYTRLSLNSKCLCLSPSAPHPTHKYYSTLLPILAVHLSGTHPRTRLCLRTISSSTFANIVIISQQRIILHTDTNLTRARFQHSQLRQIIFSLLSEMNIKVPLYHVALITNHHISSTILPLTITVKYLFIYLHSNCQNEAAAVSHQPVDYVWFTGLSNSLTSVVTLAQGYSGDWWPCPHTLTQKHAQAHANTHADVFRQASLTTTQGHAHRSRQTQRVNSVGTRCDLKSSDWIRGKHCKWEIGASVWSALEKKLQNKG